MAEVNSVSIFGFLALSYFLGSIPSGYLAGKWCSGIDLRLVGSGSTGATNVFRHVGKFPALIVFVVDVSKGIIAIKATNEFLNNDLILLLAGVASLSGHIWPIWLKWKGGKAVATGLGVLLGISWTVGLACLGIFLIVLSVSKIVSLSSVVAAISLPILMALSFPENEFKVVFFYFSLLIMGMVIWRHRSNIKRLLSGEEPKINQH